MQNNKFLSISLIIVALSILLSSAWLGYSIQKSANLQKTATDRNVMNLSQVANYLGMTEEDVQGIIETENKILETTGIFSGRMFSHFMINGKLYFYKEEIDEWLKEVSFQRKEYNTTKGSVF